MIDIKDIQGNILLSVPITQASERVEELMANDHIQLSWNSDSNEELQAGCYIDYNSERFSLLEPYKPTQKNEMEFTYTPQFKSKVMAWGKTPFFFYTTNEGKTTKEPDWTLTSNPADFMKCVCDALLNETGEQWTYVIDASLSASASLSFSTTDVFSGLNEIAGAFQTEWYADKVNNTLYLGKASFGEPVTLEVGNNIQVPSVNNTKEGYYTRFYAFGSTRNIAQDYKGSNVNNLVNKRLTLDPVKYPNGYKDIREGLKDGEIFSKVLIFDKVYPSSKLSISGVRNRLMYRVDSDGKKIQIGTDESGNPIYDQYAIWYFRIEGFTFDMNSIIEGKTLSVNFQTGALSGREFELKYYEKNETITTSDGLKFDAKAGDYEILFIEESNYIIPSLTGLVPSDGDKVILFNIEMPSEYTQSAYDELEAELDKEIERLSSNLNNYTFNSNPVAFNENNPNLSVGRNVIYKNGSETLSTRVIKLTTKLDFPIEQNITIGNEKIKGNTQQLKEEVATANKDLNLMSVFNDMTQTLQQSYNRTQQMMLEGFASIKNIWQIKEDSNGVKYIFSEFNVATQGGYTQYADSSNLNIPSIYAGIPVDGTTITKREDGTLMLNPNLELGGLDEEALQKYLDDYNYAKLSDIPSLDGYAKLTDVDSRISDLVNGAPQAYDTLKEIADVLQGNVNSIGDIITTLGTKWTQDDSKIANWDSAYGWGNHADAGYFLASNFTKSNIKSKLGISDWALAATKPSYTTKEVTEDNNLYFTNQRAIDALTDTLKAYVTLKGTQTIEGEKNFVGGLKVNGSPIYYDSVNGYWKLEGDLLVTGGVTQYASESAFNPSTIMDAVNVDGQTIIKQNGILMINPELVLGGGGEGEITSVAWGNVIGKPSWITDTVPYITIGGKKVSLNGTITSNMIVDTLGYAPYDASNPNGYITSAVLNGYLPLSGGTLTGNLALKSASSSDDTPKLYFQRGTTADGYYDCYIYNTGGGITFGYSSDGTDYDLVKVTSTTLRPNSNNIYALGAPDYNWGNIYTKLINGGTPIHSNNIGSQSVNYATSAGNADTLGGVQLSGLFTDLSSTADTNLSITVGGITENISNLYARYTERFRAVWNNPAEGTYDLNDLVGGYVRAYGSGGTLVNAPKSFGYGAILSLTNGAKALSGQLAWDIKHGNTTDVTKNLYWRVSDSANGYTYSKWHQIAFTDSNVASATKLANKRKIWGQEFNGESDVDGLFTLTSKSGKPFKINWMADNSTIQLWSYTSSEGFADMCLGSSKDTPSKALYFNGTDGYWGVGTIAPQYKLDVNGSVGATQYYVNGIKVSKTQDGVLCVDGNLVVTGGITAYYDNGTLDLPNIYDGLPIDGTTIYWAESANGKVLKAKVSDGGLLEITDTMIVEALGYVPYSSNNPDGYITSSALNGYATQSWVNQQGFLTEHQDLSGYQTKITSTNKLAYSLISGTPDLSGYLKQDGNAASSTKLQTARSIWGQSFDGTGNVTGTLTDVYSINMQGALIIWNQDKTKDLTINWLDGIAQMYSYEGQYNDILIGASGVSAAVGYKGLYYDASECKWGIGNTTPEQTLDVNGTTRITGAVTLGSTLTGNHWGINDNENNPQIRLTRDFKNWYVQVSGDALALGTSFNPCRIDEEGNFDTPSSVTINGIKLYKSNDGVLFLDGNLVVRGGITQYADDGTTAPSIFDSLPVASTSVKGIAQFSSTYFSVSNGIVTIKEGSVGLNEDELNNILEGKGYLTSDDLIWSNIKSKPTTIAGYGITDAVTLTGTQYISGAKYFQRDAASVLYIENTGETNTSMYTAIRFRHSGAYVSGIASSNTTDSYLYRINAAYSTIYKIWDAGNFDPSNYLLASSYTASDVLAKLKTVDGKDSGLDADLLDGKHLSDILASNVASATKLATSRKIWGQSFDGQKDVKGNLYICSDTATTVNEASGKIKFNSISNDDTYRSPYIQAINENTYSRKRLCIFQSNAANYTDDFVEVLSIKPNGNIGINQTSPEYKLDISGSLRATGNVYLCKDSNYRVGIRTETPEQALDVNGGFQVSGTSHLKGVVYKYNTDKSYRLTFAYNISSDANTAHIYNISNDGSVMGDLRIGNTSGNALVVSANNRVGIGKPVPEYKLDVTGTTRITGAVTLGSTLTGNYWYLNNSSTNPYLRLTRSSVNWYVQLVAGGLALGQGVANSCTIDASGNFLSVGGITQYSDIRKKTKLNDVELTLKQVANAPLIEHYYNSDDKKTTHVGSIAQYWAGLNDWFCKLDGAGYYTMEIQNAALASAISVARELERYESKTDKTIRMLKKRINELEDEIEKLKSV